MRIYEYICENIGKYVNICEILTKYVKIFKRPIQAYGNL